jgi:hypothetical protein
MKEIHGLICQAIKNTIHMDGEIAVRVYDGSDFVGLVFSTKEQSPRLTYEETLQLAKELRLAASRLQIRTTK